MLSQVSMLDVNVANSMTDGLTHLPWGGGGGGGVM